MAEVILLDPGDAGAVRAVAATVRAAARVLKWRIVVMS